MIAGFPAFAVLVPSAIVRNAILIRATGLRGCFVEQLAGFFQKSHLFFG